MKHLKKFENWDLGHRFSEEEEDLQIQKLGLDEEEGEDCKPCAGSDEEEEEDYLFSSEQEEEEDSEEEEKDWNDEEELRLERISSFRSFNEKKMNPGFKAYLDKQKAKKDGKDGDKKDNKKTKPDFLDLDKDGDKKESMKKAAKDAKEDDKKEEKGGKGLTAAQKKLPEGLRKAIEAKKKK